MAAKIIVQNVSKNFISDGVVLPVVDDISLAVESGKLRDGPGNRPE